MAEQNQQTNTSLKDLLKTSWMRSSIKLALILTAACIIAIWLLKTFNIAAAPFFASIETFFASYGLAGIFVATIIAGTIIPLGSPALVAAAALFGVNPILLILVATTGFTIGMIINYALAYKLGHTYVTRKISPQTLQQITQAWHKYGWIIYTVFGLIPLLPVEILSFICGLLKTRLTTFIILSFVPRLIVFTLLAYFGQYMGAWLGVA